MIEKMGQNGFFAVDSSQAQQVPKPIGSRPPALRITLKNFS